MEGEITDEELGEYDREARECVKALQPRAGIVDLSDVTAMRVSSRMIADLAGRAPVLADPSTPRVLIAPAPAVFGMARMFQLQGEATRPGLRVVNTREEAWEILGLKKEPEFVPYKK